MYTLTDHHLALVAGGNEDKGKKDKLEETKPDENPEWVSDECFVATVTMLLGSMTGFWGFAAGTVNAVYVCTKDS